MWALQADEDVPYRMERGCALALRIPFVGKLASLPAVEFLVEIGLVTREPLW